MDNQNNNNTEATEQAQELAQDNSQLEQSTQEYEQEPEIAINDDGELQISESFFDTNTDNDTQQALQKQKQADFYSDEELNNTPFENWDIERLPENVKKYAQIQRQQLAQRQAYQQQLQQQQQIEQYAPKQLTPQELSKRAVEIAKQKLGLSPEDDFDYYDPEHSAALSMSIDEVREANKAEIAQFNDKVRIHGEFTNFVNDLMLKQDFKDFDQWVVQRLSKAGMNPSQLTDYAQRTGDLAGVQRTLNSWYQLFTNQRMSKPKAQTPPTLEHSTGLNQNFRGNIDYVKFGQMDMSQQAQILKDLGVV